MDLGTQFCERCGRDRDSLVSTRNTYRDCPSCGAACCADCWNLVEGACLVCAPFRLVDATTPPRIVVAAAPLASSTDGADPYADLRGAEPVLGSWDASWGTARQRPKEAAPAGIAPLQVAPDAWRAVIAEAEPVAARTKGRRAGRIGLAAGAAWVVVAGLAMVALGASPQATVPVPPEATPTVAPTEVATPVPARPTATPRQARPARRDPATQATGGSGEPRGSSPADHAAPDPAPDAAPDAATRQAGRRPAAGDAAAHRPAHAGPGPGDARPEPRRGHPLTVRGAAGAAQTRRWPAARPGGACTTGTSAGHRR